MGGGTSPKKRKGPDSEVANPSYVRSKRTAFLDSFFKPVSPPLAVASTTATIPNGKIDPKAATTLNPSLVAAAETCSQLSTIGTAELIASNIPNRHAKCLPSPVRLTRIADLSPAKNVDTVRLHDILGNPLISEAWIFNYCFDIDWLMQYFDPDIRDTVEVNIVHGSWRREDMRKIMIDDACNRMSNVKSIQAHLPDLFGTHHSKMFVLFRHDDYAQVVIHTANMIEQDWRNLTQAVWLSPLLPLSKNNVQSSGGDDAGIGACFRKDLLRYLNAYQTKLKPLVQRLSVYDFSEVKAVLIASVPSKFSLSAPDDRVWGHEMLRRALRRYKKARIANSASCEPHFVFQVSSIATISTSWLEQTLYAACESSQQTTSIIFPTAIDVAKSLDGYRSGASIHTKAQTPTHLQQISTLRSQLCRWTIGRDPACRAGRDLAAPHIKTYIRFAKKPSQECPAPDIDWAMVTSANLSTQAWGSIPKLARGEKNPEEAKIHIQSYEIGVLVWPEILVDPLPSDKTSEQQPSVRMVPVFQKNEPDIKDGETGTSIGFRMPYDLPLKPYPNDELPWSPQSSYTASDRHGKRWP